jgi:hypothetical protein
MEIAELTIFRDVPGRKVAVVIKDRLLRGMIVIQAPRRLAA